MVKRLLFIRHRVPEDIKEGGERLTEVNLSYIREIFDTTQIKEYPIRDKFKENIFMSLILGFFYFFKNFHYGLTPRKMKDILKIANDFEIIYIDRSIFGIIAKYLKKKAYKGKIITFFHNFEQHYYSNNSKFNIINTLVLKSVKQNENCACQYSDIIIALNDRDQNLIKHHYNRKADFLIPISLKDSYTPSSDVMNKRIEKPLNFLFVGSYFKANIDGILWFIAEVFPFVNIRLQIVGKRMGKLKSKLPHNQNIEIIDSVPDLTPYYENADCMIMPIFSGSGMKVKTCEAMMYGKNIIGSSEAFEGYNVDFGKIGGLANTKEEFIETIHTFENYFQIRFNKYARTCFLDFFSEKATVNKFREILNLV